MKLEGNMNHLAQMSFVSRVIVLGCALLLPLGCSNDTTEPSPPTTAEILAYADEHYDVALLAAAFGDDLNDFAGTAYYHSVASHEDLTLWVSQEDDEDEFYLNIGKWSQFVFGWDDFVDPRVFLHINEANSINLSLSEVSAHREIYRAMLEQE
jgi:hypothetical protein